MKNGMTKISLGALNITKHPHSPEDYLRHFQEACRIQRERREGVKIRGDIYGMIGACLPIDENDPLNGVEGNLFTYLEIGRAAWSNIDKGKPLSEAQLEAIINGLPPDDKPNFKSFRYIFYPRFHLFVFMTSWERHSFSPKFAETLIAGTLNSPSVMDNGFRNVEVTICQSMENVERLLSSKNLISLEIIYTRPNPDDQGVMEKMYEERMARVKAIRNTQTFESGGGNERLAPDDEMWGSARLAAKYGEVKAREDDGDGKVKTSNTKNIPEIYEKLESLVKQDVISVMRRICGEFAEKVRKL